MKTTILNTWASKPDNLVFFEEENLVYDLGEYRIFKQFDRCYLHTYKNIAVAQLGAANKYLIKSLFDNATDLDFTLLRAKESMKKGIQILKSANQLIA